MTVSATLSIRPARQGADRTWTDDDLNPPELAGLVTERHRPDLADLDLRSTGDLVTLMAEDQALAIAAVNANGGPSPRRSTPSSTGCAAAAG